MIDSAGFTEMVARKPVLYHRVWDSAGKLDSILEHGLERIGSNYSGFFESRPGCVYMGDRATVLKICPEEDDAAMPWTLLAIQTAKLEPQRICPDEDEFLTQNFNDLPQGRIAVAASCRLHVPWAPSKWWWEWARYLSIPFPSLGEWADKVGLGDDPAQTRFGISRGRMAYKGVVPASAISVAV